MIRRWTSWCLVGMAGSLAGQALAQSEGPARSMAREVIELDATKVDPKVKIEADPQASADEGPIRRRQNAERIKKLLAMKSDVELCKALNGQIISYYDVVTLVEKCRQRLIADPEVLALLQQRKGIEPIEVPVDVYRRISFGEPLDRVDVIFGASGISKSECKQFEGTLVTDLGQNFFLIEDCKKRQFRSSYDLNAYNRLGKPLMPMSSETLERIPTGRPMPTLKHDETEILYRMDGDVVWSRLFQDRTGQSKASDTPEKIEKILTDREKRTRASEVCKKTEGRIVSFYSVFYLIENCKRRPIEKLPLSAQMHLDQRGGIRDVAPEEFLAVPEGRPLSEKDLMEKLHLKPQ